MRDAAQRSFVNIARRVQAIVHQQANELREMEEDHGRNPEVFDDLLRIDHGTALIGRLADSISVLGGGRPGRQWPEPVALYSVLRGAMSRILEYRRIDLSSIAKVNVKGTASSPSSTPRPNSSTTPPATRRRRPRCTSPPPRCRPASASRSRTPASASARRPARGPRACWSGPGPASDLQDLGESPASASPSSAASARRTTCRSPCAPPRTAGCAPSSSCRATCSPTSPASDSPTASAPPPCPRPNSAACPAPSAPSRSAGPPGPMFPTRDVHGGRRPRGHRVDRQRAAAAPQPGQDPAHPAVRRGRPPRRSGPSARKAGPSGRLARRAPGARAEDGRDPEPGLWVQAFMDGLKGRPTTRGSHPARRKPARTEADDEGNLK